MLHLTKYAKQATWFACFTDSFTLEISPACSNVNPLLEKKHNVFVFINYDGNSDLVDTNELHSTFPFSQLMLKVDDQ